MRTNFDLNSTNSIFNSTVLKGQLISYAYKGIELIHGGGRAEQEQSDSDKKGWANSDLEMFPIIGPSSKNYKLQTFGGMSLLDQHGIARAMEYILDQKGDNFQTWIKSFKDKCNSVSNPRFPDKSKLEEMVWPYPFELIKSIILENDSLEVGFQINGDKGMPYQFGYHPAFKTSGRGVRVETQNGKTLKYLLGDIMDSPGSVIKVKNVEELRFIDDKRETELLINTEGFGNLMLWSNSSNFLCIEPVTHLPNGETPFSKKTRHNTLGDRNHKYCFKVTPTF